MRQGFGEQTVASRAGKKCSTSQSSSNKEYEEYAAQRASVLWSQTPDEEATGGGQPQDGPADRDMPDPSGRGQGPCHTGPRREMGKVGSCLTWSLPSPAVLCGLSSKCAPSQGLDLLWEKNQRKQNNEQALKVSSRLPGTQIPRRRTGARPGHCAEVGWGGDGLGRSVCPSPRQGSGNRYLPHCSGGP